MQGLEQRHVPLLHMGEEARAAPGMGGGDRDLDEPGAERGRAAEGLRNGEARAPPLARPLGDLVDAHGADNGVGVAAESREGADRDGVPVDGVPVVAGEDTLLRAEHLPTQRGAGASLPDARGELHAEVARPVWWNGVKDHAAAPVRS